MGKKGLHAAGMIVPQTYSTLDQAECSMIYVQTSRLQYHTRGWIHYLHLSIYYGLGQRKQCNLTAG